MAELVNKVQDKGNEAVPDELPPLAEELLKSAGQPAGPIASSSSGTTGVQANVPDELPILSDNPATGQVLKPAAQQTGQAGQDEEHSRQAELLERLMSERLTQIKTESAQTEAEANKEPAINSAEQQNILEDAKPIEISREGFFSSVAEVLKTQNIDKEKLLSEDLFNRMRGYWDTKKGAGRLLSTEEKLKAELLDEIRQLEDLEYRWQVQRLAIEEDKRYLDERERDIKLKIELVKSMSKRLKTYQDVGHEKAFFLHNGMVAKNLRELLNALQVTDEETFGYHVTEDKNDFAAWIRNVICDEELAARIEKAKARMAMAKIIEEVL